MLNVSGLHEVKTFGGQFSWMGNRRNGHLKIKLDRVVANSDWQEQFPNAKAQLLHWIGSDHRPLLLFTDGTTWRGLKQFKYDNRWKNLTEIHNLIKDTWLSKCNNLPPQAFHEALKTYRSCLSQWRRRNNWNSAKKIQKLYTDLQKASDIDVILQLIKPRVSSSMNLKLTEPVTEKEIFHALSQMNDDKTPGPDGFTAAFFKNHWDVIKSDTWCNWVMKCISSVTYSVLINGSPTEKLHPQRGLRQATREECSHVLQLLQIYANASGQYTNFQKSALLFAKSHISSSKI